MKNRNCIFDQIFTKTQFSQLNHQMERADTTKCFPKLYIFLRYLGIDIKIQ